MRRCLHTPKLKPVTHPMPGRVPSCAHGHTLPELLVGLTLGLLVIVTALAAWQTARNTWLGFVAQQSLRHNARVAFDAIATQARLAGAVEWLGAAQNSVTLTAAYNDSAPAIQANDGGARGSDSLSLGHWRSIDGADCLGNVSGSDALVQSRFQRSTSTTHDFACKDLRASGSTFQALAEGVEDMQVQLAETSADGVSLQWKTPQQVSDGSRVQAIEVCLQLVNTQRSDAAASTQTGCRGEALVQDKRPRLVRRHIVARQAGEVHTP